jgi:tetratricopeptide (TPR) repeat protein
MSEPAKGEWVLIQIDEKPAKRQGIPPRVPVPKAEFEGLADKGLQMEQLKQWISQFLTIAPSSWRTENAALAKRFDAFIGKVDMWKKAQAAFQKNDYKTAISTLKLIGNIDPDDHAAKMNLGSALASTGDTEGALKIFTSIRESMEGEPDYHVALGHVYTALQKKDEAIGEMVLALEAKGDHQPALDGLKNLGVLTAVYEDPRDAASLTYVRSDSVLEYMKEVWDREKRDLNYYLEQIVYHEAERRFPVVIEAADRALAIEKAPRAILAKAAALRAQGKDEEALAVLEGDDVDVTVERARCLSALGKKDESKATLDKALAADPGNLMALDFAFWPADRSNIQEVHGILPALQQHADAHASSPGVWRSLARAKLVTGAHDEAFELFKKALGLDPKNDDLRAEYWGELARQRRFDEVIADAQKIEDIKKHDWKLRWNEAEAYAGAGKKMEARACFTAINADETLHVDVRKRAKRAANQAG